MRAKGGVINYVDYSLEPRQKFVQDKDPKDMTDNEKLNAAKTDCTKTKINKNQIDITNPLSMADWENINDVVNETNGLSWV